jgi:hypothetical protein
MHAPHYTCDWCKEGFGTAKALYAQRLGLGTHSMHLEMVDESDKRRRAARERVAKRKGVKLALFSEGDFVLAATATGKSGHKLALVRRGHKRIVKVRFRIWLHHLQLPSDMQHVCSCIEMQHEARSKRWRNKPSMERVDIWLSDSRMPLESSDASMGGASEMIWA